MWKRRVGCGAVAALLLAAAGGCDQSSPKDPTPTAVAPAPPKESSGFDTVAQLHWLGRKRLGADTNATHFLSIWNLPEATHLQNQTLDKLAMALAADLSPTNAQPAKPAQRLLSAPQAPPLAVPPPALSPTAALLRPLLADLVEEEAYLEIGAATNQPGELVLAVHLTNDRAAVWQTNLSSALNSLTASHASGTNSAQEWSLTQTKSASIHLQRQGDWTVIGLTRGTNAVLSQTLERIRRQGVPCAAPATNDWLETAFDLPGISRLLSLGWTLPDNWPAVRMTMIGESGNVRTRGELRFPKPLALELTPWSIPTNLIHDPLIGFTAIRGVDSWLKSLLVWKELKLTSAPDQIYIWAQAGMPVLEYAAGHWPNAKEAVQQLSSSLPGAMNSWLKDNIMGYWTNSAQFDGLSWRGAPFVTPELRTAPEENDQFVVAGLVPFLRTNLPAPAELLQEVGANPHWVLYAWEMTGPRLEQTLYTSQLARLISRKPQLPPESSSLMFLRVAITNLANSVTVVSSRSPTVLDFSRKSTIGLDSVELQVVADWLESPTFPVGLHTFIAPAPPKAPANPMRGH